MKKLIAYLYRRYCTKPEINTLFIKGIQRDFSRKLTESEEKERNFVVYNFLQTGWFEQIFNEHLAERLKILFDVCETQKQRDYMHDCIKDLLKFEERFKNAGIEPDDKEEFDKFDLTTNI